KQYGEKAKEHLVYIFSHLMVHHPALIKKPLSGGAKSLANQYLRGNSNNNDELAFFCVGVYIGLATLLLVFSIITVITSDVIHLNDPVWVSIFSMYGGMFIVVLSFF